MLPTSSTLVKWVLASASLLPACALAQILIAQPPPLVKWDYALVQPIVTDVQAAAEQARLAASEQTRPGLTDSSAALSNLTTLASAAQHLVTQINQYPNDPALTRQGYLGLIRIYQDTTQNVLAAGYDSRVMQDFNRIGSLLDRLSVVYTQPWDHSTARSATETLVRSLMNADRVARERAQDNPVDRRAMFLLQRVGQAARQFNEALDREPDPLATGEDFRLLTEDYGLMMRQLPPAGFDQYLEADLAQAGLSLARLRQAYQVGWNGSNARTIAGQIRGSARHVLDVLTERPHQDQAVDTRLFDDLLLLAHTADAFTRLLEVHPEISMPSLPQFLLLAAAYRQSAFDLALSPARPYILDDFNKLGQQITLLHRMYSSAGQEPGRLTGTVIGR